MNPQRGVVIVLAILLALSLAGNGVLGWAYLGERDESTEAETELGAMKQQRDGAREAASACSDAVDDLRTLADKRAQEAKPARDAATAVAHSHNQRADTILSAPAAVPGDDCRSAQVRVHNWLQGRARP